MLVLGGKGWRVYLDPTFAGYLLPKRRWEHLSPSTAPQGSWYRIFFMQAQQTQPIPYFGYGTNRDRAMMVAMVGRENLLGEPGKLLGYELCVQALGDIPNMVAENAPASLSPREIVERAFGSSFELYIIRPSPGSVTCGTIWYLTSEELKLVHEWELLEFGMQQKINALATNSKGESILVDTHGSLDPHTRIDRAVRQEDYTDYLISKEDILRVANAVRLEYMRLRQLDS